MAETPLDCGLCSKPFSDPVTLGCDHSFCSDCLRTHWDPKRTGDCPTCHRRWSKEWPLHFALKKLSPSAEGGACQTVRSKRPKDTPTSATDKPQSLPSTSESPRDQRELWEWFQSEIQTLKKKKERITALEKDYKYTFEHSKKQAQSCETQIRAQFNQLHRFLRKEEELCLSALRQEQEKKAKIIDLEIKNIESDLTSLSDSIQSVEKQLQQSGTTESLIEYLNKLTEIYFSEPVPELRSGLLIDQAKILGNLGFRVWRKMRSEVHYSPVILDPNTSADDLCLSEDLTSVRHDLKHQRLPDHPERFTNDTRVLGSPGLTSGPHQWDVEVGDHPDWEIGLASESVERKEMCSASPKNGFRCLKHYNDKYLDVDGKTIELKSRPDRIRVCVDYEKGVVSFYDVKDMTEICSHKHTFTEKIFPYFSVGKAGDAKTKNIKIYPSGTHNQALLGSAVRETPKESPDCTLM